MSEILPVEAVKVAVTINCNCNT